MSVEPMAADLKARLHAEIVELLTIGGPEYWCGCFEGDFGDHFPGAVQKTADQIVRIVDEQLVWPRGLPK